MILRRTSNRAAATALALVIALGGVGALGGCSLARNVVDGATGGKVDIGGASLPKSFPKADVPLADGDVTYGAGLKTDDGQGWNVVVKVSGIDAADAITTQLTGAGFTQTTAGRDDTGATGTYTKAPYTVLVLVTQTDAQTGWTATYTVTTGSPTASPTPSATSVG